MLKINIYIPESTVEVQNQYNPDELSMDLLLYWSFETRIDFIDTNTGESLFLIPDAALFQILKILSDAKNLLLNKEEVDISSGDREGSYDLRIKSLEKIVEMSDEFSNKRFKVDSTEFIYAVDSFIKTVLEEVETKFPKLLFNMNYINLKKQFLTK